MNHVYNAMEQAGSLILNAYRQAAEQGALPAYPFEKAPVEIPKDVKNGDYASSFAMQAAKPLGMAPRKIAEALCANIALEGTVFSSCEIAGPGFINLRLAPSYFTGVLENIAQEGAQYGRSQTAHKEKVMVEFVSANPTGPMHMGNARGGVLGDSLAEVLDRAGNEVSREFYVNDAGNQIDKFAQSLEARYFQRSRGKTASPSPKTAITATISRSWPGPSMQSTAINT